VERVFLRMRFTRSIGTAVEANCRPFVTEPVSGVFSVAMKGRAMAFFVRWALSSASMVASRPRPSARRPVSRAPFQIVPRASSPLLSPRSGRAPRCCDQTGLRARSPAVVARPSDVQRVNVTPSA